MESTISWPKMIRLPQNKKPTYWLNSMPQMWPSGLTFTMTLNLNFQGQIWNLLYLSQRWFDCHKIKSMHIEIWSEGLNDHQVWPWPWPWKVRCKDLPASDRGDFRCGHAIDSSSSCVHDCLICIMEILIPGKSLYWNRAQATLGGVYPRNDAYSSHCVCVCVCLWFGIELTEEGGGYW